ncbi:F-box DNA helicase 1-like [Gigantopelta aegis]|uniref:F-box DNA helicase 1-like n=1 Tax=Gigantopelta aegis TaxID=1735272 RepID=UPI001B887AB7|nr:F-box DNA helicase 1-like [Gigantopelta aegis]
MAKGQNKFKAPRRVSKQSSTDSNTQVGENQATFCESQEKSLSNFPVPTESRSGVFDQTESQDVDKTSDLDSADASLNWKCFWQRKRKIHVDVSECLNFSQSETGSKVLTNPHQVKKSSKDCNRGLHPRSRTKRLKKTQSHGLDTGTKSLTVPSQVCNTASCTSSSYLSGPSPSKSLETTPSKTSFKSPRIKYHGKRFVPQKNTLSKYFTVQKIDVHSCIINDKSGSEKSEVEVKSSMIDDPSSSKLKDSSSSGTSYRTTSKMYSPIKKLTDIVYICDSSSDSSSSVPHTGSSHSKTHPVRSLFTSQQQDSQQFKCLKVEYSSIACASCESDHSKTFGLLGDALDSENHNCPSACSSRTNSTSFEHLPLEVVELIFCQLPVLDLCLNCNRVCTQWNEKISDPKFIPWKKLYHRLRKNHGDSFSVVVALMTKRDLNLPSKSLLGLIRFMLDFKPVTANNMTECLAKHDKYKWACTLIEERVEDCIKNKTPNPWCIIASLVITSSCVADVSSILSCLTVPLSQCTTLEVLECLYCLATMLYGMHLKHGPNVWTGMHYRVFYALYLYENASVSTHGMLQETMTSTSGQQSIVRYSEKDVAIRMTHEQMRIVKCDLNPGDVVKIVAFAGTGKTSTLVRYTQMRPDKRFLLLVYNKSVCDHAKKMFPHNVTCKTGHGLAYGVMGTRYASKLNRGALKVYDVTQILPLRKGDNMYVRAKFVIDTLNNFLVSDTFNISTVHVPDWRQNDDGVKVPVEHAAKVRYAEDAEYLWKLMQDLDRKTVGMTHDGYLKLYQLSEPRVRGYDIILIDEAQDLTPAVIDILMNQSQCKILVGDPHQQIYSFRGAINAMQMITATQVFYLTQSFRFGPEIAHVAASCLEVFKNIKQKTIVGHGISGCVSGEKVGQMAIICRSNFTVFSEAVKMCCYRKEPCRAAFVGGTEAFGFGMLHDMYTLMLSPEDRVKENHTVSNKFIKMFKSFSDLERYASRTMDTELGGKIRIVRTFHNNLPMCLKKIREKCVHDITTADVVFSTAHKSKGLEFSTVRITDDYIASPVHDLSLSQILTQIPVDETNLLYVAVTRAKRSLQLSPMLMRVLANNGEKFVYPVLSSAVQDGKTPLKCFVTDAEFQPKALTLRKNSITLSDNSVRDGGLISPAMLTADKHVFHELLGCQTSDPPSADVDDDQEFFDEDFAF